MLRPALLVFLVACVSLAEAISSLPAPTGKFNVGKSALAVGGESVMLWFPAQGPGETARYVSSAVLARLKKNGYYEQTAQTIESWPSVRTHSSEGAKPISDRVPLVVFLPGAGVCGFQYTAIAEEFASHGYMVALVDYFSPEAPKRTYDEDDFAATENDMARVAVAVLKALGADPAWQQKVRFDRAGIAGHSIGGAAAIGAARLDRRFIASLDMDGAPFGNSVQGTVVPLLVLRSKPIYSDADLAKRGSTREQWDKKGQEARKTWLDFELKSGSTKIEIFSIKGTGHFSFSDAPFVMPDAITRFGGDIIAPERGHEIITSCALEFFDNQFQGKVEKSAGNCIQFEEVAPGIPAALPAH
jgi:dienelactone hydrolase